MRKWFKPVVSALAIEVFLYVAMGGIAVLPAGIVTLWAFITDHTFTLALWALIGVLILSGVMIAMVPFAVNLRHKRDVWRMAQHEKATELLLNAIDEKDETKIEVLRHTWRRWLGRRDYTDI